MRLVCRAWHRHCMKLVVEHSFDYCVAPIEHTALEVTTRSYWRSTSWEPTHGGPFYAAYTALFPLINIFGKACYSNANAVLLYDAAWLLRRHMFSRQEYCWEATDTPAVLESSNATQTQIQPKEEAEGSMLSLNMIIISLKLEKHTDFQRADLWSNAKFRAIAGSPQRLAEVQTALLLRALRRRPQPLSQQQQQPSNNGSWSCTIGACLDHIEQTMRIHDAGITTDIDMNIPHDAAVTSLFRMVVLSCLGYGSVICADTAAQEQVLTVHLSVAIAFVTRYLAAHLMRTTVSVTPTSGSGSSSSRLPDSTPSCTARPRPNPRTTRLLLYALLAWDVAAAMPSPPPMQVPTGSLFSPHPYLNPQQDDGAVPDGACQRSNYTGQQTRNSHGSDDAPPTPIRAVRIVSHVFNAIERYCKHRQDLRELFSHTTSNASPANAMQGSPDSVTAASDSSSNSERRATARVLVNALCAQLSTAARTELAAACIAGITRTYRCGFWGSSSNLVSSVLL